ncbi:hypothetical protein B0H63DRAFT_46741 [Podospora didyma]|uniref:SWIM-type domain-containing protein n=1 Tax=Podospora didyma TaxID=330526 RepID=A0AAE0U8H6_9PEZI|nr:hypothetical protein B0H63DRAFT_46741 [Podospora didyma]
MSLSPTTGFSRLSLDAIPVTNQSKKLMQSSRASTSVESEEYSSEESDWDEDDEESGRVISSSTGLNYDISGLPNKTQEVVRSLFDQSPAKGPQQISLELCGIKKEDAEGSGRFYAFQMNEVVPCSVRIGARNSARFSTPKCECPDSRYRHIRPCKHIVWLFDQISKQALFDHDPDSHLTLTELGYAEELRDPFQQISQISLDVLADGLRCDITAPNSDSAPPSKTRVREAREMIASLAGVQPWGLENYRLDLESSYDSNNLIRRGDIEGTLFSLILASHSLASWVRSELHPSDSAVDPFRNLQHRVLRIIMELDAYSSSLQDPSAALARREDGKETEGPRDVNWAATQIRQCVVQIERLVSRGSKPLAEWERSSAARALVSILKAVASHNFDSHGGNAADERNLYMSLVGNHDTGFVFSTLDMLVEQSQFIEELEGVMELLGRYGTPATYAGNMRSLITRMRSQTAADSRRDSESAAGPSTSNLPRSKTPSLEMMPPPSLPAVDEPHNSNIFDTLGSGSGQFLTPEAPASASSRGGRGRGAHGGRGRGGRAGGSSRAKAGSKRSVSGSEQEGGKGSKRAR